MLCVCHFTPLRTTILHRTITVATVHISVITVALCKLSLSASTFLPFRLVYKTV